MLSKTIRILGLIIIIGFSAFSMVVKQLEKEIQSGGMDEETKGFFSYPAYFEDRFYDIRMGIMMDENFHEERLVLAAIDEESLKNIGRWPWDRSIWIDVMDKLKTFGAKVVAFDVVLSEPQKACNAISPDVLMSKSFSNFQSRPGNKVIIPYSLTSIYDPEGLKELPDDLYNFIIDTKQASDKGIVAKKILSATFPIKELLKSEPGLAHIGADEDFDGIFRHYPLVMNTDSLYFPSYSLLAYQYYTGDTPILELDVGGEAILKLKTGDLNLNFKGETKIRWIGGSTTFPTVGLYQIMKAKNNDPKMKELLNGKIIFIGSTAFGAHDLRHTPVDPKLPGVYFHMNMVQMLLEGRFFQTQKHSLFWSWGLLIVGTLIIIIVSLFGNAILDIIFLFFFCGGIIYADTVYLLPMGYEITLFFVLFSIIGAYSWNTFFNFYLTSRDKHFLKNAFGSYISPELIDEMYKSGEPPKLGGESGVLTAYFTDIQSFSTFSEKLSATKLVELLNEYLTAMTDILLGERGTLDKYEGDAIIAFFGAPMHLPDHAYKACKVAIQMQNALLELRDKWKSEGDKWPVIVQNMRMRIGINSGEIVTGNMGSRDRMNYTMMGDSVNLAARLEEAAKQYGIFSHVSQFTKDMLEENEFEMRELDTVKVVGKSEPVTTYDLLGATGETHQDLLDLKTHFDKGLDLYKNQKWDEAIENFKKSLPYEHKRYPELEGKKNPSLIYIDRCNEFKKNHPPADWDGVYTLTSK